MTLLNLAIQILSGVTGGAALAMMFRKRALGVTGNSLAGVIGGLLGAPAIFALLGGCEGAVCMIQTAAGSGSGGAALVGIAGVFGSVVRR